MGPCLGKHAEISPKSVAAKIPDLRKIRYRHYYRDRYKRTRPLRNVPPAGFWEKKCVPVQHKRTPYRPTEKDPKNVPPVLISVPPWLVGKQSN